MKEEITIVISCREHENADITLNSLARQTAGNFKTVMVKSIQGKNANWARNKGFAQVDTPYVLFSDNDIEWEPHGIEALYHSLRYSPAGYSYGHFKKEERVIGNIPFDRKQLLKVNYISTMSLIRSNLFRLFKFDENIIRLQDWDLWLTFLEHGICGVYCGELIFKTKRNPNGITHGTMSYHEALMILRRKHKGLYENRIH
jgi:glycosyltransferase involved in cell wall biosynthesis